MRIMIATFSIGLTSCVGTSSVTRPYYAVVLAVDSQPDVLDGIHKAFLTVPGLRAKSGDEPDSDGNVYYDGTGRTSGTLIRVAEYYGELIDSETRFGYRLLVGVDRDGTAERADVDGLVDEIRKAITAAAGGAKIVIQRNVNLTP